MPKSLLDILKQPMPKPIIRYPNQEGMTPLKQESGARAWLRKFPIQDHPDPYDNTAFKASNYTAFDRAKNNYGYNYSADNDWNNGGDKTNHVLRNPNLNVVQHNEAFAAVDSVGLGSLVDYRVVNVITGEYVTRKMQKEDAEQVADDLNQEYFGLLGEATNKGESSKKWWAPNKNLTPAQKKAKQMERQRRFGGSSVKESLDEGVSRKHFREVANTVRAIEDPAKRQEFADHHAAIFASQNPRFDHARFHAAAGTKTAKERGLHEGERYSPRYLGTINTNKAGEPATAHDHGIKAVSGALFKGRKIKYRGGSTKYWGGGSSKHGAKRADLYTKESEQIDELSKDKLSQYITGTVSDSAARRIGRKPLKWSRTIGARRASDRIYRNEFSTHGRTINGGKKYHKDK